MGSEHGALPSPRRKPRASWVIIAVALVLVGVILVLGHQSFNATEQATLEEFGERQLALATEASHGIGQYFRILTMNLTPMAKEPAVVRLEEAATRHELKLKVEELKPLGVWDVGAIDAKGTLRYSGVGGPVEGADFSSRAYFQRAKALLPTEDARVVEFVNLEEAQTGMKGVLVGVPMFDLVAGEGSAAPPRPRFAGLVACVLKLDFLAEEFILPVRSSDRGYAFLLDDQSNILWCVDPQKVGRNVLKDCQQFPSLQRAVKRMLAGETGKAEFTYHKFDDAIGHYVGETEKKLVAFAPVHVADSPWSIGVWAPKEDAWKLIRAAYHRQLLVVGLSILIILAGSIYAVSFYSRLGEVLERKVETKTRELKDAHSRLLKVLDSLDAIVYVADMETHEVLFVNCYTREVFGDVVGRRCWETLQGGQAGPCEFCSNARLVDASGEPAGVHVWEFQNTTNGRWYEMHDRAIRWEDGRVVRLEIAVDTTERHRQEEQILQQNRELRGKQQEIESSRKELGDAAGKVAELIDTAARDQTTELSYANPHLATCWRLRGCDHTWCPCHGKEAIRCWQVEGTSCDQQSRASFAEKVIQCRSCEVFRRSCPDRLTELAEGFNNMMFLLRRKADELRQLRFHAVQRERMATIGQMAAGIAHEIDNPIASLFSLVQVLRSSAPDEAAKAQFALMQQCIDRISKIVREIVDFGRPVASEDWTDGDVETILTDTVRLLRYDRRARKIQFGVNFERDLPRTMVIEHQLQQVFMNILLNALDAMHGEGVIHVRGWREDGAIQVAISDSGEGMRPEQISHIFEPFYTTKAGRKGSGLGLALSYNILQRHGGTIRVQSEVGKGSTFTISIPLREPNGEVHATSPNPGS